MPNTITSIEAYAFSSCNNLSNLSFPAALLRLEEKAFEECSSLNSAALPHGLVSLAADAFEKCYFVYPIHFRLPPARACFVVWALGQRRNRANWESTTIHRLRNIVHLITLFSVERRKVAEDLNSWGL